MKTHYLKIEPQFIDSIIHGGKRCEIRKDDRDYQAGDRFQILLPDDYQDYNHGMSDFLGHNPNGWEITHVLRGGQYGLEKGYVALSFKPLDEKGEIAQG